MDYLMKPHADTTTQPHVLHKEQNPRMFPRYLPARTTTMYCNAPNDAVIQCCPWKPGRTRPKTMYTLLRGRQGPHTIPFALLREHFKRCTAEQMTDLILHPDKFKELIDSEGIPVGEAGLQQYRDIYAAYIRRRDRGIESGESDYVGDWDGYGWRPLGEMLVNESPYATYAWRSGASRGDLKGKGTERKASRSYQRNRVLAVDKAIAAIDISRNHGFKNIEAFRYYLINTLSQMVDPNDQESLKEGINGKTSELIGYEDKVEL